MIYKINIGVNNGFDGDIEVWRNVSEDITDEGIVEVVRSMIDTINNK